jgi:hypothetical protein
MALAGRSPAESPIGDLAEEGHRAEGRAHPRVRLSTIVWKMALADVAAKRTRPKGSPERERATQDRQGQERDRGRVDYSDCT